jgi:hypothetical protein
MNSGGLNHARLLPALETKRQCAHLECMTSKKSARKSRAAKGFEKPAHWSNDPPPKPKAGNNEEKLSPTRYGDWEKDGIAVDF